MEYTPDFALAHVGVNPNAMDAVQIASLFGVLLGLPVKEGKSSVFAGTLIEVMRENYLGENGHIAFSTASPEAAILWLEARGFAVESATAKKDSEGNLKAIYLKGSFGGFAVHLLKR